MPQRRCWSRGASAGAQAATLSSGLRKRIKQEDSAALIQGLMEEGQMIEPTV